MKSLLTLFLLVTMWGQLVEDDIAKLATDNRGGTRDATSRDTKIGEALKNLY